jgi:hypothetical protein
VGGQGDRGDAPRGPGHEQVGYPGGRHATEQGGDTDPQPDEWVREGRRGGDADHHGPYQPDQAGDQGGVHREPQRLTGLVAGGLPIGHQPAVRDPLAAQAGDDADREGPSQIGGDHEENRTATGAPAAVLDPDQQEDDGGDAHQVGDDDQKQDRRDGGPPAGRPGGPHAVPADVLRTARGGHARRNDGCRRTDTATHPIVITTS